MTCKCGHEHAWEFPYVCIDLHCECKFYKTATPENPADPAYQKQLERFKKYPEQMKWILENWKWFRNYTNKELVFGWWEFVDGWKWQDGKPLDYSVFKKLGEPESITRARRLLVEEFPDKYGKFQPSKEEEAIYKQLAIYDFVVSRKR